MLVFVTSDCETGGEKAQKQQSVNGWCGYMQSNVGFSMNCHLTSRLSWRYLIQNGQNDQSAFLYNNFYWSIFLNVILL